jgi:chromosome segregation ATPase
LRQAAAAEVEAGGARRAARAIGLTALEESARAGAAAAIDAERAFGAAGQSLTACRRSLAPLQPTLRDIDELEEARRQAERLTAESGRLSRELESMPAVRRRHERLSSVARGLPALEALVAARKALSQAEGAATEAGPLERWRQQVDRLASEIAAAEERRQQADQRLQAAGQHLARAEAALEQARAQLAARREARDEAVCSRCGQPVSPEHIARELADAEAAVAGAGERCRRPGRPHRAHSGRTRQVAR